MNSWLNHETVASGPGSPAHNRWLDCQLPVAPPKRPPAVPRSPAIKAVLDGAGCWPTIGARPSSSSGPVLLVGFSREHLAWLERQLPGHRVSPAGRRSHSPGRDEWLERQLPYSPALPLPRSPAATVRAAAAAKATPLRQREDFQPDRSTSLPTASPQPAASPPVTFSLPVSPQADILPQADGAPLYAPSAYGRSVALVAAASTQQGGHRPATLAQWSSHATARVEAEAHAEWLERQLDAARHGEQHAYTLSSAAEPRDCSATSPMHEAWLDAQIWKAQFRCSAAS